MKIIVITSVAQAPTDGPPMVALHRLNLFDME